MSATKVDTDVSRLAIGLVVAFVFPAIAYLIGLTWNVAVNRTLGVSSPNHGMSKIWTTFYLVMPIIALAMMVRLHFDDIRAVWLASPFLATAAYVFFGILVPVGLMYLVIRLWRRQEHRR
jgi:hypothetical protein